MAGESGRKDNGSPKSIFIFCYIGFRMFRQVEVWNKFVRLFSLRGRRDMVRGEKSAPTQDFRLAEPSHYSCRSDTSGSMAAARSAGIQQAAIATTITETEMLTSVAGSLGLTS